MIQGMGIPLAGTLSGETKVASGTSQRTLLGETMGYGSVLAVEHGSGIGGF